jgi:signal transduction histidine kinase
MATIQWYIRQFQRLYGKIGITYQKDIVEEDVPETMKIIIYRLVQEGLTNAEKHSGAKSVLLHLGFSSDRKTIRVDIEDDGNGFDVSEVLSEKDPMSGYGLVAMRERCEIYGGAFHISSKKGRGTRIHATLPI